MAIIGIDLGTTNSLCVVYRNHRTELIPNRWGSYLTPSVVSIEDNGNVITGEPARERIITCPERTAASFKRFMGTDRKWQLGNYSFSAEDLSSFVIRSLIEDAELYLGESVEEAVISVPAYFHDRQRTATKRAGALAGVPVRRLINEPSAAALASYMNNSSQQLFLVFDFGGGTLDVSIVDCFDTIVEIISVSGDNRLGGDNFHEIMTDSFLKEHGLIPDRISPKDRAVLCRAAELCKEQLTENNSAVMQAELHKNLYKSSYTDRRLTEESGEILDRIRKVLTHALKDCGYGAQDLAAVVMVGGSSKMPMIQSYIQHLFHRTPVVTGNCQETVARGLGVVCGIMQRSLEVKDYILTDICPFTLGTDTNNPADPSHPYMTPIIQRNTVLPCSRVQRFFTSRNYQTQVDISILQGEQIYAEDNLKLGLLSIQVPKKKKGEEAVDIRFTYDINGILIAEVTCVSTGKTISRVISENMSQEEIQRRMKELEKLKIHPRDLEENQQILNRLKLLYEESPTDLRENLKQCICHFEYLLNRQDVRPISEYRKYLENLIGCLESYDPFTESETISDDTSDPADIDGSEDSDLFTMDVTEGESKWKS